MAESGLEKALRKIEQVQESRKTALDLEELGLTEVPEQVWATASGSCWGT